MNKKIEQELFDVQLNQLYEDFVAAQEKNEPEEKLADAVLELILDRARAQAGATDKPDLWGAIDKKTLSKMASWDTDDSNLTTIEKVFKRLADGRRRAAITLVDASVTATLEALSKSQSQKAKKPRKRSPVVALIQTIVGNKPDIHQTQLLHVLKQCRGGDISYEITEDEIVCDGYKPIKISGLKDHLYREKKKKSQ